MIHSIPSLNNKAANTWYIKSQNHAAYLFGWPLVDGALKYSLGRQHSMFWNKANLILLTLDANIIMFPHTVCATLLWSSEHLQFRFLEGQEKVTAKAVSP